MFNLNRSLTWIGGIDEKEMGQVLEKMNELWRSSANEPINLFLSTCGGRSQVAFGFYDLITALKVPLHTIILGCADSAGIIVFLAGERRHVTPHATMMVHETGRKFSGERRYTSAEVAGLAQENSLLDGHYVELISSRTKLKSEEVSQKMRATSVLDSRQMIEYGIAHELWQPTNPA